jgi:hypothetical protein
MFQPELVFTQLSHKSGFYRDRRWSGQTPSVYFRELQGFGEVFLNKGS